MQSVHRLTKLRRKAIQSAQAYRNLAAPAPPGVELVEPTLEDAYLLLRDDTPALV